MSETTGTEETFDDSTAPIVDHRSCTQCPMPKTVLDGHAYRTKVVLDAIGNIGLQLTRSEDGLNLWDVQVLVWSINEAPDQPWDVEHWATAGVPAYIPPNCPEYLWVLYTVLGDMCSHYMDQHITTRATQVTAPKTIDPPKL